MSAVAFQITSLTIVYSTVYSRHRPKKHQSSVSPTYLRGIHRWSVNSPHKGPVMRKMFLFDDVIMIYFSVSGFPSWAIIIVCSFIVIIYTSIVSTSNLQRNQQVWLSQYSDVIMNVMPPQITGVSIACSTVCSVADQRKHQSSASLAFVRGINRWPVDSPNKESVTPEMFPFDDVIVFI